MISATEHSITQLLASDKNPVVGQHGSCYNGTQRVANRRLDSSQLVDGRLNPANAGQ